MKKGKLTIIALLIAAIVFAGIGGWGLFDSIRERNSQPTEFEKYEKMRDQAVAEVSAKLEAADQAMTNIQGYYDQLVKNRDAVAAAGGSTESFDKAIADADAKIAEAGESRSKMAGYGEKIDELASLDESADDESLAKNSNFLEKRLNQVNTELKRITKIDKFESASAPSVETFVRKKCEETYAEVVMNTPEMEATLGEQFTVTRDTADIAENVVVRKSFAEVIREGWDYFVWLAGILLFTMVMMIIKDKKPETYKSMITGANRNMMLVALVVITLIFFVMTRYTLLSPTNVSNIINQNAYIIILACGMLMCIVCSANIDLSVGRVMGFIGACAAKFMIEGKMPVYLAIPLCLLIGMAIGAWQGFWIAYMKIPAFVVTLAGQLTFYGLTMMILKGLTINNFPAAFNTIFNSYLPDFVGGIFGYSSESFNLTAMVIGVLVVAAFIAIQLTGRANRVKKGYPVETVKAMWIKIGIISVVLLWLFYSMAAAKGLPTVLFTVALILLIYLFITSRTVLGRHLYAMGGNVNAARLSGVKTQKMLFLAYVNMGLLAALAGLVYAARLNAASPQAGAGDELYAIASCYIGGASAYGGIGTVGGALIGALTMGVIKNGMSIMSLGQDIQQIVLGMVLLMAVVVDIVSKSNGSALSFLGGLKNKKEKKTGAVAAAKA